MRGLLWVILLAALAVALTLGARYNPGYVLLVVHPYRVELSLNLLLALLLAGFVAAYAFARVVVHTLRLPDQVRRFRDERRLARAQRSLLAALQAFLEGRFAQAEKAAAESIELRQYSGISAVLAARAAHELRAYERRDRYLARSGYYSEGDQTMRLVTQAELLLQARQHQEALAALERLPRKHTAALRLELRAVQLARNWDRYLELLAQLERLQALDDIQLAELRRYAIGESLARKGRDLGELRSCWQRLGARERQDAKIAAEAARAFLRNGQCVEAQQTIEASLEREWDGELVALYAQCAEGDVLRQIERAEGWLRAHPADADLLLALATLCARQRLWGKARSYIEASLSVEESFEALIAAARLLDAMGETEEARRYERRALEAAERELGRSASSLRALSEPRHPLLAQPSQG
ncbi:MAG: heme biosynthesis protein HemY [Burkholderiales bacterium]|nr:heme biosynthesis protein HemY [Burkholderiales bacterium]